MTAVPEFVPADAARLLSALELGHATVTVRSKRTGAHVTLTFAGKRKGKDGKYLSRATAEGRVGLGQADSIFVTDPDLAWPENDVGRLFTRSGDFVRAPRADRARTWTAEAILDHARLGGSRLSEQADIFVATKCHVCGRKLTHPESVAEGIGPECAGRVREGRPAPRTASAA